MQSRNSPSPANGDSLTLDLDHQDDRFGRAFAVLQAGIEQRAFPGASLAVAHQGKLVAGRGLGHFTYDQGAPRVEAQTIYDLASLTKVLVTTAICMRLHELGSF